MENKIIIKGKVINMSYRHNVSLANRDALILMVSSDVNGKKIHNNIIFLKDIKELFNFAKNVKKEQVITVECDAVNSSDGVVASKVLNDDSITVFQIFGKVTSYNIKSGSTNGKEWMRGECEVETNSGTFKFLTWGNKLNSTIMNNKDNSLIFKGYTKICYNQIYDTYYTDIIIDEVTVAEAQNA